MEPSDHASGLTHHHFSGAVESPPQPFPVHSHVIPQDTQYGITHHNNDYRNDDSDEDRPPQPFPTHTNVVDRDWPPQQFPTQSNVVPYRTPYGTTNYNNNYSNRNSDSSQVSGDDKCSCATVFLVFWTFVSMNLALGVYGSLNLRLTPNSSILIKPNPLFVEYVKVEELNHVNKGLILYGLYGKPPLDNAETWSESHKTSLPAITHKEWEYCLNTGSHIDISYNAKSLGFSNLVLIIAEGDEGLAKWLENPSYPNSTLSWNIVHGEGMIQQNIFRSSCYYVAVGNLNSEVAEVQLNIRIQAVLYNTSEAYFKCTFEQGQCNLKLNFIKGSAAVLTSPSILPGAAKNEWHVKVSYGPRWITYLVGIVTILLASRFLKNSRCSRLDGSAAQSGDRQSERNPLLSHKDNDIASRGSSCDSISQDDEDLEDGTEVDRLEGKPVKEGEPSHSRRNCAICFDAPRDCFFHPCRHCVACFACGTRITESAGVCPICRRPIKKVRKVYIA